MILRGGVCQYEKDISESPGLDVDAGACHTTKSGALTEETRATPPTQVCASWLFF